MSDEMPDLESAYDEEISPLMTQIIAICKKHRMPMVASFRYAEDGYCTTVLVGGKDFHKSELLARAASALRRSPDHFALAETHVTNPDGSKHITIRRVT